MMWYVKEQMEEEYIARRCLELFDQIPTDDIYRLDKELSKVSYPGDESAL